MTQQRISRRLFGTAGLAALGTTVLGPGEALAQPPASRKRHRLQRTQAGEDSVPTTKPQAIIGLELEASFEMARNGRLFGTFAILNHSSNNYVFSDDRYHRHIHVDLHAFGQRFPMTKRSVSTLSRRTMIVSRRSPWRRITLPARSTREPSRTLFDRFFVPWPDEIRGHVQDLQHVPAFVSATLAHPELQKLGLAQPLKTELISLDGLPLRNKVI